MAAERTSAAESRFVDAIARRVIELLDASRGAGATASATEGDACLTVSQVASRYRVSRSWVYAHQRELGAMRLGEGPRPDSGSTRRSLPTPLPPSIGAPRPPSLPRAPPGAGAR